MFLLEQDSFPTRLLIHRALHLCIISWNLHIVSIYPISELLSEFMLTSLSLLFSQLKISTDMKHIYILYILQVHTHICLNQLTIPVFICVSLLFSYFLYKHI